MNLIFYLQYFSIINITLEYHLNDVSKHLNTFLVKLFSKSICNIAFTLLIIYYN